MQTGKLLGLFFSAFFALHINLAGATSVDCDSGTDVATDKAAIISLYESWKIAVKNGNRERYLGLLDENIQLIPPGSKDIIGKDAYAEFLIPVFQHAEFEIVSLGGYKIDVLGDIALARYDYIVNIFPKEPAQGVNRSGLLSKQSNNLKYTDVLRRQQSGEWKVLRHTWTDNVAEEED